MNQQQHRQCYGNIFPPTPRDAEQTQQGKVFSVRHHRTGGLWPSHVEVSADIEAWDKCCQCTEFEHCYKLSMAKVALTSCVESS